MRRWWLGGLALVAGAALLVVGGANFYSFALSRGRDVDAERAPARDVAVIFAAQVYTDFTPAPFTAARLDLGLRLFESGRARVLVVSGNNSVEFNRETTSMRAYLEARGVPASAIVEDEFGNDTYDTCLRLVDTFGVQQALLITQSYHVPRAVTTCRALGVDAIGVGDSTVSGMAFWPIGVAREIPANVKMLGELLVRRPASVPSPPSDAVAQALAARP